MTEVRTGTLAYAESADNTAAEIQAAFAKYLPLGVVPASMVNYDFSTDLDWNGLVSVPVAGWELAMEFMYMIAQDQEAENIPAIEKLPSFMSSMAAVSAESGVPLPRIFEGGEGSVGFMWVREQGNCYLYAELDTMQAQWVERENGERSGTESLDMRRGSDGWDVLGRKLLAACAA